MNLHKYLNEKKNIIEDALKKIIYSNTDTPKIYESMNYSLFAGGKRLRPIITIMACELFDGNINEVIPFACCLELIHTYSLIHDDLPAMDNDDFRRGKLTNHKIFGDGFAILAGDALLNKSYEILFSLIHNSDNKEYKKAAFKISEASGVLGMIGGQALDLFYENKEIPIDKLIEMHDKKTGALIKASLETGAIIAKADEKDIKLMGDFGHLIGRAFQIMDDVLDEKGTLKKLGKNIGRDSINKKATYVKHFGLEQSEKNAFDLIFEAKKLIRVYGNKSKLLADLAEYIVKRDS
ncbi:MAG: polyprenyl synthetase family protein [Firmicutes bacterium]|nr:polyprenyl synthetase family protein [Bacillota bacterium]